MTSVPTIHEIRRYPVKSMAGESLRSVEIDARGLVGDRWYAVVDGDGKLSSGKHSARFRRRDLAASMAGGDARRPFWHLVDTDGSRGP